jgi:predicted transporter
MHRFIPAMSSTLGCSVAEVGVRHHARQHGTSKYGLGRVYRVVFDLIVIKTLLTFAQRPTAYLTGTAVVAGIFSLMGMASALYAVMTSPDPSTVVFMSVSVLLGSLALFLGLVSIIAALIYHANTDVTQARIGEWSGW